MKKKLLSLLLCASFVLPAAAFAACGETPGQGTGGGNAPSYDIVVWVGEGTEELTESQIAAFNKSNEWGVTFNAQVEIVSESVAAGNAINTPESAADIFCFAQDQLARLVAAKRLVSLNNASVDAIVSSSDADSAEAAKIGNTLRAFPMTADNGFFLYYDKSVIPDEHAGSLEEILSDCKTAGKNFSMNLTKDGGSWYAASFFYATGCVSEWETDENGAFVGHTDTFDSAEGVIALKGMQKVLQSNVYQSSAEVSDFSAAVPSAAVVSGIWGYNAAKTALGENLGVAPLPSFTVDGQSYPLVSYLGRKLMGVKPQDDPYRALYLQKLAMYLTGEECQRQRFEAVGWGPSNKKLQEEGLTSPALNALANSKTTLQGQYPTNWWAKLQLVAEDARTSLSDDATLRAILGTYSEALPTLKS